MSSPAFSLVIPTRNRPHTLAASLKTCLGQGFDDYEIVVCDNCGGPETRQVVEAAGSDRVKYVRSDTPLAMTDNWNLAVENASGTYVSIIGDDDGYMPFALSELSRLRETYSEPDAIHWTCGYYYWPDIIAESAANYMALPLSRWVSVYNGREQLARCVREEISFDQLPTIYHSAVHRRVLEKAKDRTGKVFAAASPDIYSAYAFAYLCETYISTTLPMHINGASGNSNGVASAVRLDDVKSKADQRNRIHAEFRSLSIAGGHIRHPTVPDCDLWPAHFDDAFQYAREALFPDDEGLALDRRRMMERYVAAIPNDDPETLGVVTDAVKAAFRDEPDLVAWFSDEVRSGPKVSAAPRPIFKPERLGFDGNFLLLDTADFGVVDIVGAVNLAANLLKVPAAGATYDIASHAEINRVLIERTRQAEHLQGLVQERTAQSQDLMDLLVERTAQLESLLAGNRN